MNLLMSIGLDFMAVPSLVLICYLMAELYKWIITDKDGNPKSEKAKQFIPILCGLIGLVLGVLAYYLMPKYLNFEDVFTAAAVGITSGFAATGVNQVFKQFQK